MKRSRVKSLVVVDDRNIRKVAFQEAERLIKKLERLEKDIKVFQDEDQRLYSDWFDLSFRKEQEHIKSLHERLEKLSVLHNWMIAVSRIDKIPLDLAIEKVYAEEELYVRGTVEEKARIEKLRGERDQFIRRAIEEEYASERNSRFDSSDPFGDDEEEDGEEDLDSPRSVNEDAELQTIKNMTDKKIRKICLERDRAYALIGMTLMLAKNPEEYSLFIRVWDLVPQKHQSSFARKFSDETDVPLKKIIERMREELKTLGDDAPRSSSRPSEAEGEKGHFDDHFIGSGVGRAQQKTSGEELEHCKLIYRKLVRRLHPDLQAEKNNHSMWQKQIWHRVQQAYHSQNTRALEKLYRLVMIRLRELNEITMGEILDSKKWLADEIDDLNREAARMKKLPAWGFSRRKTFEPVRKKVEKSFSLEQKEIEANIWDLESQHQYLLMIAKNSKRQEPKRNKRAKNSRSRRAASGKAKKTPQRGFFD